MIKMNKKLFNIIIGVILISLISCGKAEIYYISPNGNDSNNGSKQAPFANLETALDQISIKRKNGNNELVTIFLREGAYNIKETFKLNSSLNNIVIKSVEGEKVSFNGGVNIKSNFIQKENSPYRYTVNLKEAGISNFGHLRNVGFARPYGSSWGEIFINKKEMHLARWPNKQMIPMGKVLDKGSVPRNNDFSNRGGIMKYDSLRINKWVDEKDAWISGYFMWGYAEDMVAIDKIDIKNHTIKTKSATLYGYGDSQPWRNWYGVNIFNELDEIGEYYIDREKGILHFISDEKNINSLEFSILEDPFFLIQGANNITIEGITFECSRGLGIAMDNTENVIINKCVFTNLGSLGITIGKGVEPFDEYRHDGTGKVKSGVVGSLAQHIYLNDTFNREAGKNNKITDCIFYQLGAGGISIGGGNRLTLEEGNNIVNNCLFHDINRIEKSYRPAIHVTGVGNIVSHCEIYNTPSMAILMYGNNHIFEYNYIHDVCLEVEDQGAFYYGRSPSELGTIIRYNYFENIPDHFNTCAIYHDDGACGLMVIGNVFYKAGKWNVLLGGGSFNVYQNNIFIGNQYGIHIDNRLQNWAKSLLDKNGLFEKKLNNVDYKNPPYSIKYPELVTYLDSAAVPKNNIFKNNAFVQIKNMIDGKKEWLNLEQTNIEFKSDLGFIDFEKRNFKLKKNSSIYKKIPNFKDIPFNKIGLIQTNNIKN